MLVDNKVLGFAISIFNFNVESYSRNWPDYSLKTILSAQPKDLIQ